MKFNKLLIFLVLLCTACASSNNQTNTEPVEPETSEIETSDNETSDEPNSSDIDTEVEESLDYTINASMIPSGTSGQYPDDGEYSLSERNFYISLIQPNTGKYSVNTIQMKKDTSYLYNIEPFYMKDLSITIMKNEYNVVMHKVPTIYVSDSVEFTESTISPSNEIDNGESITYNFSSSNYTYFKIANESSYAQYILEISWK